MKRFVLSIILIWLSIISFSNWSSIYMVWQTAKTLPWWGTYSVSSWTCVRFDSSSTARKAEGYDSNWNLIVWQTSSADGAYTMCFWIDWYVKNNNYSSNFYFYDIWFTPSSSCSACPSCPTCPTCQTCNTWIINIYELSDPQYPVYSNSTANWSFNYNIYYNDYVKYTRNWSTIYFTWEAIPECEECPEVPSCPSTWEILSWYILESSIDSSYCIWNWYCPVESWSNWSSLFINWIQHESYPMINIDITDNVPWDYSINNDVFDLDVWEAYDQDFIDWVIDSQKTLPNKTDFNNTISWLIPLFIPWLVIILFIYFIFRFIKKIF